MTTDERGEVYLCPYCETEYPTEMLVRVHVSEADDDTHGTRDGMTPEVEPVELADGTRMGTAFTPASRLNLHGLSLEEMPTAYDGRSFDERERRALLVAAFNANRDVSETELQDRVTAHLTEHGMEPLSAEELRDLCEHVFHPHAEEDSGTDDGPGITTAETTLRDLTALQQAIILAHLARPDTDQADIARQVGTATSYPVQVIDARSELLTRLRSRIEETSLERVVAERVPTEDLREMDEEGYLDGVGVDLAAVRERKRHSDPDGAVTAGESPHGAPAAGGEPERGDRPVETAVTAPDDTGGVGLDDTDGSTEGDGDDGGDTDGDDGGDTDGDDGSDTDGESDGSLEGTRADGDAPALHPPQSGEHDAVTVPRAEVERLRRQVAFDLAVVEREMELADPTPQQVRTKAYLERILERLDGVLSRASGREG